MSCWKEQILFTEKYSAGKIFIKICEKSGLMVKLKVNDLESSIMVYICLCVLRCFLQSISILIQTFKYRSFIQYSYKHHLRIRFKFKNENSQIDFVHRSSILWLLFATVCSRFLSYFSFDQVNVSRRSLFFFLQSFENYPRFCWIG